jgi:hypothetical protein
MKNLPSCALGLAATLAMSLTGCVNSEGRLRPPDPLGRMLFDALDPGPKYAQSDAYYAGHEQPRTAGDVWVEGSWGRDARGQRVWVPAHWARGEIR